jgi:hypothetical protein
LNSSYRNNPAVLASQMLQPAQTRTKPTLLYLVVSPINSCDTTLPKQKLEIIPEKIIKKIHKTLCTVFSYAIFIDKLSDKVTNVNVIMRHLKGVVNPKIYTIHPFFSWLQLLKDSVARWIMAFEYLQH